MNFFIKKSIMLSFLVGIFCLFVSSTYAVSVNIDCSVGSPRTITVGVDISSGDDVTLTGSGTCVLDNPTELSLNSLVIGDESTTPTTILTHSANTTAKTDYLDLSVSGDVTIHPDASINIQGKGYSASNGSGGATNSANSGAGGAYGGNGGNGTSGGGGGDTAGTYYGSITTPNDMGSGGSNGGGTGASGGGFMSLDVTGTLTVNGSINANGADGSVGGGYGDGGGAGGGLYINVGILAGTGDITADGGDGADTSFDSGGGGGGRIAIYYTTDSSTLSTLSAYPGEGGPGAFNGSAGTVYTKSAALSYGDLLIDNNNVSGSNTTTISGVSNINDLTTQNDSRVIIDSALEIENTTFTTEALTLNDDLTAASLVTLNIGGTLTQTGDITAVSLTTLNVNATFTQGGAFTASSLENITINSGGTLNLGANYTLGTPAVVIASGGILSHIANTTTKTNYIDLTVDSLDLQAGGSIDVDGKGYSPGNGPGAGTESGTGGGGAYGGDGGNGGSGGVGGSSYGSSTSPNNLGSGGGLTAWGGGAGGGLVRIVSTGTITVDGTISANGDNAADAGYGGGGGAGGGIYLFTSGTLTSLGAAGILRANGGDGGDGSFDGGGGGGGRIAVIPTTNTSSLTYTVAGGASPVGAAETGDSGSLSITPSTPTMTAPTSGLYNTSVNPTLTTSAFAPSVVTHTSTDWFVTTDSGCSTVVWSKENDAVNLLSIVVNDTNGTFSGALAGQTTLAENTQYYACALHTSSAGDSGNATAVTFTTEYTGAAGTQTWDFDDDSSNYTFDGSYVSLDSSFAGLTDLGGGTYSSSVGVDSTTLYKDITITNSSADLVTDYQVKLTVSYEAGMESDFDDLRFTSSDGVTELDYWVQEYTASSSALVWVEIPTLAASGDTIIRMYYGNSALTSESNASNTLLFYDDFDTDTSANYTSHTHYDHGGSGSWVWDTGNSLLHNGDNNNFVNLSYNIPLSTTSVYVETYNEELSMDDDSFGVGWIDSSTNFHGVSVVDVDAAGYGVSGFVGATSSGEPSALTGTDSNFDHESGSAFKLAIGRDSSGNIYAWKDEVALTQNGYDDSSFTPNKLALMTAAMDPSPHFSYLFATKFVYPIPSVSFGTEASVINYSSVKIQPSGTGISPTYSTLLSISHTLGGGNAGAVSYQISNDGANWYYHDGSSWTAVSTDSTDNNTIAEVNNYLPAFDDSYTGDFYFKAFLNSNGTQVVELDSITLTYDDGAPSGLADLEKDSNTTTEAVLSWTPATEVSFSHYEIWYGESQSDVQNRTGTATEWDDGDDANLSVASTSTTTITSGLTVGTTYYAKIWAIDTLSNETTISDIEFTMISGGGNKTAPRATDTATNGGGQVDSTDSVGSEDRAGLERLGVALNTPENDTEIAVAGNELMQGAKFIRLSELDERLDELQKTYTTVYFLFRYNNLISPIYSKVLGDAKPEIVQEDIIEELENIEDKEVEFDSENKVETNENEDITQVAIPDGKAIARIVGMEPGDIFKITDNDAVYYLAEDGTRHIFPNEFIYYSYYDDFKGVKEFTAEQVGAIPLGDNKKLSPGTWLVKIVSDPKVYAVEPGGVLRHVSTENVAEKLYGPNWNKKIIDINVSLFVDYSIGEPLTDTEKHPDGVLVTYDEDNAGNDDVIYYVRDSELYQLSENDLQAFGARRKFIEVIDSNLGYVRAGI